MALAYRITNWQATYENSETRKIRRLSYVAEPNSHDSKGYKRVSRLRDAPEVYCAFRLMVQVASQVAPESRQRWGWLADRDGPLTAIDLADRTGFPERIFARAFEVLVNPEIGWLEQEECDYSRFPELPQPSVENWLSSGQNGKTPGRNDDSSGQKPVSSGHVRAKAPNIRIGLDRTGPEGTGLDRTGGAGTGQDPAPGDPVRSGVIPCAPNTGAPVLRAGNSSPGPDRDAGTPQRVIGNTQAIPSPKLWVDKFVLALCAAFRIHDEARMRAQHRAFARVGWCALRSPAPEQIAHQLHTLAMNKRADESLSDPIKAWQKAATRILTEKGLIHGKEQQQEAGRL